jgi:hypothetical protein
MATPQFPLDVVKERPACCRVVCFGGLGYSLGFVGFFSCLVGLFCGLFWAFFLEFLGSFFVFYQLLRVSFWCFLFILPVYQGAPLPFFNKYFLTYQKKKLIGFRYDSYNNKNYTSMIRLIRTHT